MKNITMRQYLIATLSLLLWVLTSAHGQEIISPDTTGYERQRQKVNELLQQRSARFGQYEESLQQRTGIFGLKTKKDMQASIDILKEIVLTDNYIFQETKQLVDFKDFETEMITQQAREFDSRINGYIATISKLQKEQAELREQVETLRDGRSRSAGTLLFIVISLIFAAVSVYVYYLRPRRAKRKVSRSHHVSPPSSDLDQIQH